MVLPFPGIRDDPVRETDHRPGHLRPAPPQDPGRPPEEHRGRARGAGGGGLRRKQVKPEIFVGGFITRTPCSHKVCSVAQNFATVPRLWPAATLVPMTFSSLFLFACQLLLEERLNHRHQRKIDWLMARTACLVCLISTAIGRSKKSEKYPWMRLR